jgi:hypothetical protein
MISAEKRPKTRNKIRACLKYRSMNYFRQNYKIPLI